MTQMRFDRLHFIGRASDYCGDDLPRAGSVGDRVRYAAAGATPRAAGGRSLDRSGGFREPRRAGLPTDYRHTDRDLVAHDLAAYVTNATTGDLGRRPRVQRAEMVKALVTLSCRLRQTCGLHLSDDEKLLLANASCLIARWRLT